MILFNSEILQNKKWSKCITTFTPIKLIIFIITLNQNDLNSSL